MGKQQLLIIDDDFGPRESLRFLFKDIYEVYCAESVDQGVELLKKLTPDCIISDIKMPGKTGIKGLEEIRAIDPDVSIIMLTGFGSLETAQEAIRHGANDYLKKPFDTHEIRGIVAKYAARTTVQRKRVETTQNLESLTDLLKNKLDEKEHLATLGEQSSEFVHDLSNPLSVINGYVQILISDIRDKKSQDKDVNISYLEQIEKSVSRCREMLTLWRERSCRSDSSIKKIIIADLITEISGNAQTLALNKQAEVILTPGPGDCLIEGDNVQVFRAIQNIVGNALDALPDQKGKIYIAWTVEGQKIKITVEDNAGGFPANKITDLQTKYYTTKGDSGGMGLGLFITKNIIEAHGGSLVLANNEKGTGAFVTLAFPLL